MPCSELFWQHFLEVFPKALGAGLGVLPAILGCWCGFLAFMHDLDRPRADARLGPRVADLEGRLLRFEEARRQRGGSGA